MTQQPRHIDDFPPAERLEKLIQIKALVLDVIRQSLPTMAPSDQVRTLERLAKLGVNPMVMLAPSSFADDALAEAEELLS